MPNISKTTAKFRWHLYPTFLHLLHSSAYLQRPPSHRRTVTPSCLVARKFYCLKFWEEMERCTSLHNADMIWNQSKWTEYILVLDVRIIFSSKKRKYPLLVFTDWLVLAAGLVLDSITITVNPSTTWCARTPHTTPHQHRDVRRLEISTCSCERRS